MVYPLEPLDRLFHAMTRKPSYRGITEIQVDVSPKP